MADPGNVEHQIAIGRKIGEHRDQGTGIGMPVGKIGKAGFEQCRIVFAHNQPGHHGPGIGQVLAMPQPQGHGFGIESREAQPALDPLIEHQGRFERRITPFEIVGRPMRQVEHQKASLRCQTGSPHGYGQGVLQSHFQSIPGAMRPDV